jgi:hypothetical protein
MSDKACFQKQDFSQDLPAPGYYRSKIANAHFRRSANGNRMLVVSHLLDGATPPHDVVPDYFVLEGASPRGLLMARRRLVQLHRACGLEPSEGDAISPADLFQAELEVRIEHDEWESQPRLRVVGYRRVNSHASAGPAPF